MAAGRLLSIDRQIQTIVLAVTGIALLLTGTLVVCLDLYLTKAGATVELVRQAEFLSILSREAVLTADRTAGERALSTLRLYPAVTIGILYDQEGRELARYDRPGPEPAHSVVQRAVRAAFRSTAVEIQRPVPIEAGAAGRILLHADLSAIYDRATHYAALVVAFMLLGLTLAWIVGNFLCRRISGPILELTRMTRTAPVERDFSLDVQKSGLGDLDRLIEQVNALRQQIQDLQQAKAVERSPSDLESGRQGDKSEIAGTASGHACTHLTRDTDQLQGTAVDPASPRRDPEAAHQSAQDLAALESQFRFPLAQEFRMPLTMLLGMMDLLLRGSLTEQQQRSAAAALASGRTLLSRLNDLAALSDLAAGSLVLRPIAFDLRDTAEEALDLVRADAHAKGLRLTGTILSTCPAVLVGDDYRIRQILRHLLNNAVTFTHQGKIELCVSAALIDEGLAEVQFDIKDTGIGIAQEDQARLLALSPSVPKSPSGHSRGAGLGLSLVTRLVRLMGGTIGIDSRIGHGSTVWLRLPLPIGTATPPFLAASLATPTPKILIVAPHAASRQVLTHTLKGWGLHPEEAPTETAALNALRQTPSTSTPFTHIILDLILADGDGLTLIDRLKHEERAPLPSLILLAPSEFDHEIARQAGVDVVLAKPVRYQALYRALVERLQHNASASLTVPPAAPPTSPIGSIGRGQTVPSQFSGRILLVEDNSVNQEVARTILEQFGCEVEISGNGLEALTATGRTRYALVLMDCHMPEMDGFEATRRIRAREAASGTPRLPIIALTTHALESDRQSCFAAGMDDSLSKPFTRFQLERMLARWLPPLEQSSSGGT
ncbi:MAG: response regulator [Nitrospiraceae bacterium]